MGMLLRTSNNGLRPLRYSSTILSKTLRHQIWIQSSNIRVRLPRREHFHGTSVNKEDSTEALEDMHLICPNVRSDNSKIFETIVQSLRDRYRPNLTRWQAIVQSLGEDANVMRNCVVFILESLEHFSRSNDTWSVCEKDQGQLVLLPKFWRKKILRTRVKIEVAFLVQSQNYSWLVSRQKKRTFSRPKIVFDWPFFRQGQRFFPKSLFRQKDNVMSYDNFFFSVGFSLFIANLFNFFRNCF